ncbi:helix-turn-helix domain-containing protein, partial [Vibrio parahaemolyticus]|uniref:helix-turn-helix domain-containing protein n=1 Tax=Vibrio parahaemolyticus TaxID=670 RepID=UPI001EEA75BD
MDISYRQLKAFIALAEERTFTYAADKVHITQSALSQMMKKLAQQLSCELFERKGRVERDNRAEGPVVVVSGFVSTIVWTA